MSDELTQDELKKRLIYDASKAYDDFTKKSHGEFYYKVYGDINDKQI